MPIRYPSQSRCTASRINDLLVTGEPLVYALAVDLLGTVRDGYSFGTDEEYVFDRVTGRLYKNGKSCTRQLPPLTQIFLKALLDRYPEPVKNEEHIALLWPERAGREDQDEKLPEGGLKRRRTEIKDVLGSGYVELVKGVGVRRAVGTRFIVPIKRFPPQASAGIKRPKPEASDQDELRKEVQHYLDALLSRRPIIIVVLSTLLAFCFLAYIWTRPPALYRQQGWNWAGSGIPGRSEWRFPGSSWNIESLRDKPELVINGQTGQAGWPDEFDDNRLTDFVLRFKMRFPDDLDADGTKLVWMVRTQGRHWLARFLKDTDVDSINGYQFSLVKKGNELYVAGRVVRHLFSEPSSLNKPLHLGLHCCQSTTEYEVIIRAYQDQLDNCITAISRTDLNPRSRTFGKPADPDSGHPALAHFQDSTYSRGSVAFASGDAAKRVIVRDIEVINLAPEFNTALSRDPNRAYFLSKDFKCQ